MFNDWANGKIQKLNWVDMGFVKISVFSFTLLLIHCLPRILLIPWQWIAAIFTGSYFYLVWRMFIRKDKKE